MPADFARFAELLPAAPGGWEPVSGGQSGVAVFVDPGQGRYAKVASPEQVMELATERDRGVWINATTIPSARVLDWRESGAGACLVTQAVPGIPASQLDAPALRRSWPLIVAMVRDLHDLATDRCPFDRGLGLMMSLAEATVAEDRVRVEFLPVALQDTPPRQILDAIEAELPTRLAQEWAELVVCHGDLCLPNILVDPATGNVNGLIDFGRLGTADPYGDIALLLATARETWSDETMAREARQEFADLYGSEIDLEREDFYRRLDPLTW